MLQSDAFANLCYINAKIEKVRETPNLMLGNELGCRGLNSIFWKLSRRMVGLQILVQKGSID